jgi:hypothetical protein
MGWFLRLSCLAIVAFGFYVLWQYVLLTTLRPPPPVPHRPPESVPAAYRGWQSVPTLPVDHVAQRPAI